MQGTLWVVILCGCKGEVAGSGAEIIVGRKGGGLRGRSIKQLLSFGEALEMNQGIGVVIEERGVVRGVGRQGGEHRLGPLVLAGLTEQPSVQAGDGGVLRVGSVQLFDESRGLFGLVLVEVKSGELGVEGRIVGVSGDGRGEKRLCLIGFVLADEEMGEGCDSGGIVGSAGEEATVGGLRSRGILGLLGELGREERVVGGLGGELDRGEKSVASLGGVGGGVEMGEGAEGSSFEGAVRTGEIGGGQEFGAGVNCSVVASEKETEGEVGLEVGRVGGDGAPIGLLGSRDLGRIGVAEGILGGGEVEEDVGVVGVLLCERGKELESGREISAAEGFRGLRTERVFRLLRLWMGAGTGIGGAGRELGLDGNAEEDGEGKGEESQGAQGQRQRSLHCASAPLQVRSR